MSEREAKRLFPIIRLSRCVAGKNISSLIPYGLLKVVWFLQAFPKNYLETFLTTLTFPTYWGNEGAPLMSQRRGTQKIT